MKPNVLILLAMSFLFAVICISATAQDCGTPPESNAPTTLAGYAQWCHQNHGNVVGSGASMHCQVDPNWCHHGDSASSGGDLGIYDGWYRVGQILGSALGKWLAGSTKPKDSTSPVPPPPTPEEVKRQQELNQQREAQRQQEAFRNEMKSLEKEMKGPKPPSADLPMKDSNTCFFQTDCRPRELTFKSIKSTSATSVLSDPIEALRISTCLSNLAARAATADESSYLSEQAAKAMRGDRLEVDIGDCKGAPAPATVEGKPVGNLTTDQVTLYEKLLDSTNRTTANIARLEKHVQELEKAKTKASAEVTQKQKVIQGIREQPVLPTVAESQNQDYSLAEAEAALKQAQKAESDADAAIQKDRAEEKEATDDLRKIQSCMERSQTEPNKAGELVKTCGN